MFYLTSDIEIGGIKVKANKVTWKTSVNSFTDTCTISLPRTKYLKTDATTTANAEDNKKVYAFKEDDKVTVKLVMMGKMKLGLWALLSGLIWGYP